MVSDAFLRTQSSLHFPSAPLLRYAGHCYDDFSGLYYLSQRYNDPATAQFITKDPAKADGEESAYQYCGGDPVGKVDPSGAYAVKFKIQPAVVDHTKYLMSVLRLNAGYARMKRISLGPVSVANVAWFIRMVKGGGAWDLKLAYDKKARFRRVMLFRGQTITPEQFGNLHFGYVGAAHGYHEELLRIGSLAYHVKQNGIRKALRKANLHNEYADHRWIKKGWSLWWQYGGVRAGSGHPDRIAK